jgi:putative transposase
MALWQRKLRAKVHIHSDQGSQFTDHEWQEFLEQQDPVPSLSRRGKLLQPAEAGTHPPKKFENREEVRRDVFDNIAFFYNLLRKHVRDGMLSPIAFEQQQKLKLHGVQETRGYPVGCRRTGGTFSIVTAVVRN